MPPPPGNQNNPSEPNLIPPCLSAHEFPSINLVNSTCVYHNFSNWYFFQYFSHWELLQFLRCRQWNLALSIAITRDIDNIYYIIFVSALMVWWFNPSWIKILHFTCIRNKPCIDISYYDVFFVAINEFWDIQLKLINISENI